MSGLTGARPSQVIEGVRRDVPARAPDALDAAGDVLVASLVETLSTPGRGRLRRQGTQRKGHSTPSRGHLAPRTVIAGASRASAPGDPPAPDTGNLRGSVGRERRGMSVLVGLRAAYARFLNDGTRPRGGRTRGRGRLGGRRGAGAIAPRPILAPALERCRALLGDTVRAVISRALSGRR